jgi:hypothetical protein
MPWTHQSTIDAALGLTNVSGCNRWHAPSRYHRPPTGVWQSTIGAKPSRWCSARRSVASLSRAPRWHRIRRCGARPRPPLGGLRWPEGRRTCAGNRRGRPVRSRPPGIKLLASVIIHHQMPPPISQEVASMRAAAAGLVIEDDDRGAFSRSLLR